MATDIESDIAASIWERVIRFEGEPSATAARALLKMQFPESDRQRMRELAAKARAGTLTATEERETEAYERLGCLLDIIHSQARVALKHHRAAS
ncbi:MAG TPA: hypothetical protein VFI31_22000 [Pirellulales bacterium]|nr:hypothetical protein [Pirellulales bacterium]